MSAQSIKNGLAAFLLSILTPGLGQVYNGQMIKAVCCFLGLLGFLGLSLLIGLTHSLPGLIGHITLFLGGYLFVGCEAAFTAVQQTKKDSRPAHGWRSYALGLTLIATNVALAFGNMLPGTLPGVHAYIMRAESMAPTLTSGERILGDMRYYAHRAPQRGDLVIFREPTSEATYVKRIVALGGDVVLLKGKSLTINDTPVSEPYAFYDDVDFGSEAFGPETIPADQFFLLGDNRNHSYDSRYWGTIGAERIMGRPLYIYWSSDRARIGRDLR